MGFVPTRHSEIRFMDGVNGIFEMEWHENMNTRLTVINLMLT